MKRKSFILMTVLALSGVLLIILNANAGYDRYDCTVVNAGPAGQATWIVLTDTASPPAFVDMGFKCPEARSKEMLAVAIAAISNNLTVQAIVDPDAEDGKIYGLFLLYE